MIEIALLTACFALTADEPDRPNVLLIVGDDQGWGDFSFMGHEAISTPIIDALAATSAVFPNGYVPTSLCRSSLATLLTGLYAHQHKICCNDPPEGIDRAAMHPFIKAATTIPRLLGEHGYASFQTGKFWEGSYSNAGFTEGMTAKGRHGDDGLAIGRQTLEPIASFLDRHKGEPFFLWYAPMLPHQPHNPPERLLKKYDVAGRDIHLARYFAMCEWFDETVGEVLGLLDERGLRDNTLVVFVIDNGWIQETGGEADARRSFAPKSKRSPYDGGVRTPVILSWPGRIPAGCHEDLVSTIDIAPTILTACGVRVPDTMSGLDLMPTARSVKPLDRDAVFGEIFVHTCVDIEKPALNLTHRWIRQGSWKLIVPVLPPPSGDAKGKVGAVEAMIPPQLYNLADDPREEKDLASEKVEDVNRLKAKLDAWWKGR